MFLSNKLKKRRMFSLIKKQYKKASSTREITSDGTEFDGDIGISIGDGIHNSNSASNHSFFTDERIALPPLLPSFPETNKQDHANLLAIFGHQDDTKQQIETIRNELNKRATRRKIYYPYYERFLDKYRSSNVWKRFLLDPTGIRYQKAVQSEAYEKCDVSYQNLILMDKSNPKWQQQYAKLNYDYQYFLAILSQPKSQEKIDLQAQKLFRQTLQHLQKQQHLSKKQPWWQRIWRTLTNSTKNETLTEEEQFAHQHEKLRNRLQVCVENFIKKAKNAPHQLDKLQKKLEQSLRHEYYNSICAPITESNYEDRKKYLILRIQEINQTFNRVVTYVKDAKELSESQKLITSLERNFRNYSFNSLDDYDQFYQNMVQARCALAEKTISLKSPLNQAVRTKLNQDLSKSLQVLKQAHDANRLKVYRSIEKSSRVAKKRVAELSQQNPDSCREQTITQNMQATSQRKDAHVLCDEKITCASQKLLKLEQQIEQTKEKLWDLHLKMGTQKRLFQFTIGRQLATESTDDSQISYSFFKPESLLDKVTKKSLSKECSF